MRAIQRKPRTIAFTALVLLAGLPFGAAAQERLAPPEQQVLRLGNGAEVETLDPHKAQSVSASNVLRDLYEGLVGEAADGALVPAAAERWEIEDGGLRYRFHLRREARWSNGDPVRADDFVAGLRRSADPATGSKYAQILNPILNAEEVVAGKRPPRELGVEAVDDFTVLIRLRAPTPYFLGLLTHASAYPIHPPSLKQYGDDFMRPGRMVGNGAYLLKDRVIQSHLLLEPNPHYWDRGRVHIRQVYYLSTEDLNSEFKRFRAGEIDWTYTIPVNQAKWIRQNLADQFNTSTYLGVYYYGLNLTRPPFQNNPKLRRALSLAVDRQVLATKVLAAGEQPAETWVPPGIIGYQSLPSPWAGWSREQRMSEARRLYREAGYSAEHPAEVEIRYNTSEDHKKIATVIGAMWKQNLGVRVKLLNEEWKVFLQNRQLKAETEAFRAGWIGDYSDPYTFLEIMQSTHGLNDSGYANPKYDALLERIAHESDAERRRALMQQAEALLLEDLPVIPLYFYVSKHLVKPWVVGWQPNIMDHHRTIDYRILAH
jgi:oligopeptide transport system substrate-binding protein